MKKIMLFLAVIAACALQSCVDETGPGTPSPKSMYMESSEYDISDTDSVSTLNLRWIDVGNATYKVFLTNTTTADTTYMDASAAKKGELSTLSMQIPYSTLESYAVEKGLFDADSTLASFTIGVVGTPIDLTKETALKATGSYVSATVNYTRSKHE